MSTSFLLGFSPGLHLSYAKHFGLWDSTLPPCLLMQPKEHTLGFPPTLCSVCCVLAEPRADLGLCYLSHGWGGGDHFENHLMCSQSLLPTRNGLSCSLWESLGQLSGGNSLKLMCRQMMSDSQGPAPTFARVWCLSKSFHFCKLSRTINT